MRLPFALLALGACASSPDTSTGTLTRASDLQYQCDDSAHDASFACGVSISLANGQLTATGLYKDGTSGGPGATGTLTPAAQADLDNLIASLPLSTPAMIHDSGCGGAPLRETTFAIQFDDGQARDYTFEYGSGPAAELDSFVIKLVGQIDACGGDSVTLAQCSPNTAPQL